MRRIVQRQTRSIMTAFMTEAFMMRQKRFLATEPETTSGDAG